MKIWTLWGVLWSPFVSASGLFITVSTDIDHAKRERVTFEINQRHSPKEQGQIMYWVDEETAVEIVAIHEDSGCRDTKTFSSASEVPNQLRFRLRTCVATWLDQTMRELRK